MYALGYCMNSNHFRYTSLTLFFLLNNNKKKYIKREEGNDKRNKSDMQRVTY